VAHVIVDNRSLPRAGKNLRFLKQDLGFLKWVSTALSLPYSYFFLLAMKSPVLVEV